MQITAAQLRTLSRSQVADKQVRISLQASTVIPGKMHCLLSHV